MVANIFWAYFKLLSRVQKMKIKSETKVKPKPRGKSNFSKFLAEKRKAMATAEDDVPEPDVAEMATDATISSTETTAAAHPSHAGSTTTSCSSMHCGLKYVFWRTKPVT